MDKIDLDIAIAPAWDTVESALLQASEFLEARGSDPELVSATTMTVTELVENAVKYGTRMPDGRAIACRLTVDDVRIRVLVENGVRSARDADSVRRIVERIRLAPDPVELYVERLRELLDHPRPGVSQLGLYRIAYEGHFALCCKFSDGVLSLVAERQLA